MNDQQLAKVVETQDRRIKSMINQINMKEKMDTIGKDLMNKETVLDILTGHQIIGTGNIESLEPYEKGEDRRGVIAKVKEDTSEQPLKIMIDVKWGYPTTDQVFDSIYAVGKDCSKRVIIFNGEKNAKDEGNPTADEQVVSSLIVNMNAYPLGLYIIKMGGRLRTELVDLELYEKWEDPNTLLIDDLPSSEKFREAEFWEAYFDSFQQAFFKPWEAFSGGISKTSRYGQWWDISGLKIHVSWTEAGVFFTVRVGDRDNDYVTPIWNQKEAEIRNRFPGRPVEFSNSPGKLPTIDVKFWNLPLSWLSTASIEEKVARAEQLISEYREFIEMMEYALDEVKKSRKERITGGFH
jgi:hypothetical protein